MNSSRDTILERVRQTTQIPTHMPDEQIEGIDERIQKSLKSITPIDYTSLRDQFKKELEIVSGEFHTFKRQQEMARFIGDFLKKNQYKSLAISGPGICADIASLVGKNIDGLKVVDASRLGYAERRSELAKTNTAIIDAAYAIADTGSLAVLCDDTPSMLPHFLPDCIFAVIKPEQLLPNMFELLSRLPKEKAKKLLMITGPSRTADIEKILILGAHGPRCLIVGMLEE